jgi:hypothetical protein
VTSIVIEDSTGYVAKTAADVAFCPTYYIKKAARFQRQPLEARTSPPNINKGTCERLVVVVPAQHLANTLAGEPCSESKEGRDDVSGPADAIYETAFV